ncbi:MAG TPA: DedA family protein [Candidatus Nanoarchaeia archaeon]|nr:DedA family protein [Candidatus Nanoarchaeia archaeon]
MDIVHHIIPLLSSLGVWTYSLAFTASLTESLAFVGIFIPGTAIVMLAGFSAAQGVVHPVFLALCVALGAIIGDCFSYYLGTRGNSFFKEESVFFKKSHLDKSKIFFEKHGNKSVFLARFIGPLRPFVPFFAGVSKMNVRVFLFWNIVSAILWSATFVILGYFFGHAFRAIEAWFTRGGLILVLIIVSGSGMWYAISRRKHVVRFLNRWM